MTDLLNDYYTIAKANELLEELFAEAPLVMDIIKGMTGTSKRLFAALCDGRRITTSGYTIPADIYINRASSPIKVLREACLPVEDEFVKSISTLGNPTQVKIFFISRSTLSRLINKPKKVINECKEKLKEAKLDTNKRDIKRIYKLYGEKETIKLVYNVIKEEKER